MYILTVSVLKTVLAMDIEKVYREPKKKKDAVRVLPARSRLRVGEKIESYAHPFDI